MEGNPYELPKDLLHEVIVRTIEFDNFSNSLIREEIISKSKQNYKEALKHKKEVINLQNSLIEIFNREIGRFI